MNVIPALVALICVVVLPLSASADFYRYYDERGGVNVTNDLNSVPERYRTSAVVVTEKELEKRVKAPEKQESLRSLQKKREQQQENAQGQSGSSDPSGTVATEKDVVSDTHSDGWLSRQMPLLKLFGLMTLMVGVVMIAGRIVAKLVPHSLAVIIRLALFAALAVYLFKGYSEKIVAAFDQIKSEGNAAQKAVDKRSEKTRQQAE